jgi:hypothetical protein
MLALSWKFILINNNAPSPLSLPDGLLLTESKSLYNECSREQAVYNSQQDRKSHFTPETITSIMLLSPLSYQHPVEYNTTICDMNDFM